MLNVPTMDKLRSLKFHGMLKGLEEQIASKSYQKLSFEERLGLLVDLEIVERDNRRFSARLRHASLRQQACVEDIDYFHPRGLDKAFLQIPLQLQVDPGSAQPADHRSYGYWKELHCLCFGASGMPQRLSSQVLSHPTLSSPVGHCQRGWQLSQAHGSAGKDRSDDTR